MIVAKCGSRLSCADLVRWLRGTDLTGLQGLGQTKGPQSWGNRDAARSTLCLCERSEATQGSARRGNAALIPPRTA